MEVHVFRKPVNLNPELEALREKALQESALEANDWILHLKNKSDRIHAGFLFEDLKTLQKLCLFVGESQNKISDAGWDKLGYYLGLNPSLLKVISYNNFNNEDPCYNTLLAYIQYDNATIGKIIEALNKMGRIDVLSRIKDSFHDLVERVITYNNNSSHNSIEETSDYGSLTSGGSSQTSDSNVLSLSEEAFFKPRFIPPAPLIFQNLTESNITSHQIQEGLKDFKSWRLCQSYLYDSDQKMESTYKKNISNFNLIKNHYEMPVLNEKLQTQHNTEYTKEMLCSSNKKKYGLKVFITFAKDGEKYAEEVSKVFRKKREMYSTIGVLRLSEHAELVSKDPQQFVTGAFHQVDYVCPIITPGYINLITKKEKAELLSYNHMDAAFVPYLYHLMNSHFVSNNCLNDKVRCIIPENLFSKIPKLFFMSNPIFGAWVYLSEIEELIEKLLKVNQRKNNNIY